MSEFHALIDGHTFDVGPQGTTTFLAGVLNAIPAAVADSGFRSVRLSIAARSQAAVQEFVHVEFEHFTIRTGFASRNLIDLPRLSRTLRPDVVISQYVRPAWSAAPTMSVIHDLLFLDLPHLFPPVYRGSRRILFGWAARRSKLVATVSEYSRERIEAHFGVNAADIHVIPNGVTQSTYAGAHSRKMGGPIRVICVSRLEERKRQNWAIEAVAELSARGIPLHLDLVGGGEGTYADHIKAMVIAMQANGVAVELHSHVNDAALETLIAQADFAIFPSSGEGFGIPVIEAAVRGLPCVVADNTALSELRPYFVGESFKEPSARALAAAMECLIARLPAAQAEASQVAPITLERFAWSHAAKAMMNAWGSIKT